MPLYVIDSSIWIRLWENHPPDIFRDLWEQLDASIASGEIRSPEEVLYELQRGTDILAETLEAREGLFVPLDGPLMTVVREIVGRCVGLTDLEGERNRADPFVVALARLHNGVVVTDERPRRGQLGGRKSQIVALSSAFSGLTGLGFCELCELVVGDCRGDVNWQGSRILDAGQA